MASAGFMPVPRKEVKPTLGPVRPGYTSGSVGTNFQDLVSGAPHADIKKATVERPNRGDYGAPISAPTIANPNRTDYGSPDRGGIDEAAANARKAFKTWENPTGSEQFQTLMLGAQEVTGAAERSADFSARDAAQKGGFYNADTGRQAQQDKMQSLAMSGVNAAQNVSAGAADMYGKAEGAFANLQTNYVQAKQSGDTAYAQDLNRAHMANAENFLTTFQLNSNQQLTFAKDLNQAKLQQSQLDEDFNKDLIDNNRYIQQSQQIQAQLAMQQAALAERAHEFDVTTNQFEETRADTQNKLDRYGPGYSQN